MPKDTIGPYDIWKALLDRSLLKTLPFERISGIQNMSPGSYRSLLDVLNSRTDDATRTEGKRPWPYSGRGDAKILQLLRDIVEGSPPSEVAITKYTPDISGVSDPRILEPYNNTPDELKRFHNKVIVTPSDRSWSGRYFPGLADIELNSRTVLDNAQEAVSAGRMRIEDAKDLVRYVLTHELNHSLDYAGPLEIRKAARDIFNRNPWAPPSPSSYGETSSAEMTAESLTKAMGLKQPWQGGGEWKRPVDPEVMQRVVNPLAEWAGYKGSLNPTDIGGYRSPNEQITTVDQSPSPTIQDMVDQILSGPRITTIPQLPMGRPRITDVGSFRLPTTQITTRPRDLPQPGIDQPMTIQDILNTIEAESNRQAANEFR